MKRKTATLILLAASAWGAQPTAYIASSGSAALDLKFRMELDTKPLPVVKLVDGDDADYKITLAKMPRQELYVVTLKARGANEAMFSDMLQGVAFPAEEAANRLRAWMTANADRLKPQPKPAAKKGGR